MTMPSDGRSTDYCWFVEQGELVTLQIPILDSRGNVFDVTGWSVDAAIKANANGGTFLYAFLSEDCAVSGCNVYLTILPATSMAWSFTVGWYRVKIISPTDSTNIQRVLSGRIVVSYD